MEVLVPMPGVVEVTYANEAETLPALQEPFLAAIRSEAARGPVALLVHGDALRSLDLSVPTFWLGVTRDPSYRIRVLAVITQSLSMTITVKAFARSHALLGTGLRVAAFKESAAAGHWAADELQDVRASE